MTRTGKVSREKGVSLTLRSRYGDREVGRLFGNWSQLCENTNKSAFLERKVNLFTAGCGEESVWKLWPSLDPTFPLEEVCGLEHLLFSVWGSGLSFWEAKEEAQSLKGVEGQQGEDLDW